MRAAPLAREPSISHVAPQAIRPAMWRVLGSFASVLTVVSACNLRVERGPALGLPAATRVHARVERAARELARAGQPIAPTAKASAAPDPPAAPSALPNLAVASEPAPVPVAPAKLTPEPSPSAALPAPVLEPEAPEAFCARFCGRAIGCLFEDDAAAIADVDPDLRRELNEQREEGEVECRRGCLDKLLPKRATLERCLGARDCGAFLECFRAEDDR